MDKLIGQYLADWVSGDERAFKKVFDFYLPRLVTFSFKSLKNLEDAEELSLNVMLNIWKYKSNVHAIVDFEDYLFGMLRNQIARHYRKKLLVTEDMDMIPLHNLGSVDHPEFSLKELQIRYTAALNQLPEKQREIFVLSREQGMSQKQIAHEKGLSVNTVNNQITTSLKFMRKQFIDYPEALSILVIMGSCSVMVK